MVKTTANFHKEAPTIITVFGVTGDLFKRKILPAFFDLYMKEMLPLSFKIMGFSRRDWSDDYLRLYSKKIIRRGKTKHTKAQLDEFLGHLYYHQGAFEDPESYGLLSEHFLKLDKKNALYSNKLFYLAVPPTYYDVILRNLADSGVTISYGKKTIWTRVVVEKPFGSDAETAKKLDKLLGFLFKEEQIFRVDHYLAKETIQNILSFRFSNALFEPTWNNKYIERVELKLYESIGVQGRGAFYDKLGALRDVGQNHMLQMLAAVAMENPEKLESKRVRKNRARVLGELSRGVSDVIKRGQYRGYRNVKGVARVSQTETYFKIETGINNKRWKGVPFILEGGKKMKEKKTEINIYFKKNKKCLCPPGSDESHQNVLTFRIEPEEGISVLFWAKLPGFSPALEQKKMTFLYKQSEEEIILPDAYSRILFDCIKGDQILFTSTDEVTAAWKFIMPILERWDSREDRLFSYNADLSLT